MKNQKIKKSKNQFTHLNNNMFVVVVFVFVFVFVFVWRLQKMEYVWLALYH